VRLFLWLWILLAWGPLVGRAQNLVTNPGFFGGEITGWQGNPGYIGYVPSPGGAWIGLNGELYQDLTTEAGATYTVEFSVQRFDPQQSWRPNSLEVSWENQRLGHFDFVESDTRWVRIRYFVRATGTLTRLHFRGIESPSLDNISVTRIETGFYTGAMDLPLAGSSWLEGQPIPLRSLWTSEAGGGIPITTTFVVGGVTTVANTSRVGDRAEAVWTNAPVGVHFVSASMPNGYQTPPVRIEVRAQPKFRDLKPSNHNVFTLGSRIPLSLNLADNAGTNAVRAVRILADGEMLGRFAVTAGRIETSWTGATEGSHELVFVGESEDARDVLRSTVVIHVLPLAEADILQSLNGASENFDAAEPVAQTFTAGMDGRLIAVELNGGSNSGRSQYSLRVEILDVDPVSLKPGTRTLGVSQRTLAEAFAASSTGMLHFAFPSNRIQLVAGKPYAIVCRYLAPAPEAMFLRTSYFDVLPGGQLWRRSGGTWVPAPFPGGPIGQDLVMTTWMAPSPAPSLRITAPSMLATFAAGEPIPFVVEAVAGLPTSSVQSVTFFANGLELGTVTSPPFTFTWTNPPVGNHVLQVSTSDIDGLVGWSLPVSVLSGMEAAALPRLRIEDTVSPEGNTSLPPLVFPVTLSSAATSAVTVQYSTRNHTAVAGTDFLAAAGTLTFAPGQTQAFVFVRMRGDVRDEASRQLLVELRLPDGAILERPFAFGTLFDDEAGAGKPFAYRWSQLPARVAFGDPFTTRLTALDPFGKEVSSIPGGVTIGLISETGPERGFMGASAPSDNQLVRDMTTGYRIRPKVDLVVTHFGTLGGSKVTFWTDQGHPEASATFAPNPDVWQETSLAHPLVLKAGTFHYITVYAGPEGMATGGRADDNSDLIENWGQYVQPGDGFPRISGFLNPFVDFRFIPFEERRDLLPTVSAAQFPQGSWEGQLTVLGPGPRLRLVARDLVGAVGVSERLRLPPPTMLIVPDRDAPSPTFLFHVPDGYEFRVQTSTDLRTWTYEGPVMLSSGTPIPWQPVASPLNEGFVRLIAVE
jgi:hypothetical protein